MSDDLASRVQRLEDLAAIHQLFIDYGQHLDAGDFDAYAQLFAPDAELLLGPMARAKGRDEIKAAMSKVLGGSKGRSVHIISSPVVHLDGDVATAKVMWTVINAGDDGQPLLGMVGHHQDELVRHGSGWLFQRRKGFVTIPSVMAPRP